MSNGIQTARDINKSYKYKILGLIPRHNQNMNISSARMWYENIIHTKSNVTNTCLVEQRLYPHFTTCKI